MTVSTGNPLTFTLNGVNRTANLQVDGSAIIQQTFGTKGSTFSFYIRDTKPTSTTFNFVPHAEQTVTLVDTTLSKTLFGGVLTEVTLVNFSVIDATWKCVAKDNSIYADKTVVHGDYSNLSADQIINALIAQVPGTALSSAGVQSGPQLARVVINYLSLTEAINRVTRMASVGATYGWYVDENRVVNWYNQSQSSVIAPYFTDDPTDNTANAYRYDQDTVSYYWNGQDIRNRVSVRGGQNHINNNATDYWTADGNQTSYNLTYPVHDVSPTLTLTIGGVSKTVAVGQIGAVAPSTQFIISKTLPGFSAIKGQWYLVGAYAGDGSSTTVTPVVNATTIALTYPYLTPVITQVDDSTSQATYSALPNGGVFWTVINDSAIADQLTAISRGRGDLQIYSTPEETVTFNVTRATFNQHVKAGDLINWRSQTVPDSKNSYASGVNANYLVHTTTITINPGNFRDYQIEALRI